MALQGKPVAIGNTATTIYTCPGGTEAAVHGLIFANNTGGTLTVDLAFYDQTTGTTTTVATDLSVAALSYITWAKPINMNAGDYIQATSSASSGLVCLFSAYEGSAAPVATGFTARGVWSSASTYAINDIVTVVGTGTYLAIQASTNQNPTSATAYWMFLEGISASALPSQAGQAGKYLTTDGTDASWAALDVAGGGTVTSISSDLTLTSSSSRVQIVAPTTFGLSVILPNPSSLSEGESFFIGHKGSSNPVTIKNHLGSIVGALLPSKVYKYVLADVATNDWEASVSDLAGAIVTLATYPSNRGFGVNSVYSQKILKTGTGAYTAALNGYDGNYMTGIVRFTISGATYSVTYNEKVNFSYPAFGGGYNDTIFIDTDIVATRSYSPSAPNYVARISILDAAGLSAGTPPVNRHTYDFSSSFLEAYNGGIALARTRKVFGLAGSNASGGSANLGWAVVDYSSSLTSPTSGSGTITTGGSVRPLNADCDRLEDDKVIAAYNIAASTTSYEKRLVVATISGTSASFGSSVVGVSGVTGSHIKVRALSSTKAVFAYQKSDGNYHARIVSISGTTITQGSEFQLADFSFGVGFSIIPRDADSFFVAGTVATDGFRTYAFLVTTSGTSVTSTTAPAKISDINGFDTSAGSQGIFDTSDNTLILPIQSVSSIFFGKSAVSSI